MKIHCRDSQVLDSYKIFLEGKAHKASARGLEKIPQLVGHLFPFQAKCVEHHLRLGAAACFLDTGLGKTEVQLEWCQKAIEETNGTALIWCPLAVAQQIKRRADRWGYAARVVREQSDVKRGVINICNYDRLDKLDPSAFNVMSCDEASILKNFVGKTTQAFIALTKGLRFKLVATATPAPNDHMELGNYSELLEVMRAQEMLSRFFINDTQTASKEWRLKKHAEVEFGNWLASWCRMARMPSDLGGDDAGFVLKPLEIIRHRVESPVWSKYGLFSRPVMSATSLHEVKRQTIDARVEAVCSVVRAEPKEPWIIWVDTNYEADAVLAALPEAMDVRGSMSITDKENRLADFGSGKSRVLLSKPSVCGFGLDWSHCARMVFAGRSYSYEMYYQAVRRCWRFGQKRLVKVHFVLDDSEDLIDSALERKALGHDKMLAIMRAAMARDDSALADTRIAYNPTHKGSLPQWLV